ncbi:NACHT domain-containing protein [Streptomyces sp. NPDC001139]
MSPRPGGETDKFGNRYEGAWVVRHMLLILHGDGQSITLEDADPTREEGSEFTYLHGDTEEVHQLKRQNRNVNAWTVASLLEKGIWSDARHHVESGRQFHFVSTLPARPLQELAERAQRSKDVKTFVDHWLTSEELRDLFDQLAKPSIFGSAEKAWEVLQGFHISWHDEKELIRTNATLADFLLEGATGDLAAVGLGDMALHSLGVELDRNAIEARLVRYGLRRASSPWSESLVEKVQAASEGWAASVERELLRPTIPREEANRLVEVTSSPNRLTLLMGAAGGGKSAVLHQFYEHVIAASMPILAFRLDRLENFATTSELGKAIGLEISPVSALASVAGNRECILLVDQVDAVSLASGRMPLNFDSIANLVREAEAFPGMRVVLACRRFDVENDYRIRELVDETRCAHIEVANLTDDQITVALQGIGIPTNSLDQQQIRLLRAPLNLVLLSHIGNDSTALTFESSKQLFDAYWQRKLMDCAQRNKSVRFHEIVSTLAEAISSRQRLSVPVAILDANDLALDAGVLVSEHVLVRDGQQIAFFHESFFDYAFARVWVGRDQSLVSFLLSSEQELFRRAQVRQILAHLREADPDRFPVEMQSLLLHEEIRFHIKDVVLSLIATLRAPTSAEWEAIYCVLADNPVWGERLHRALRTAPWFRRIDEEGVVEQWLDGADAEKSLALEVMSGGAVENPDRIAEILASRNDEPQYASWLLWMAHAATLHSSRSLFNLLLDAVRSGAYKDSSDSLWLAAHGLDERRPEWAAELLHAHLSERPHSLTLNDAGKIAALDDTEYGINQVVLSVAERAPGKFCELLIPYLLRVMLATEEADREGWPRLDRQFSNRLPHAVTRELEKTILEASVIAVRRKVQNEPAAAESFLRALASDAHETAQWLLYEGLIAAKQVHAIWAAELLLEGTKRLICGYPRFGAVWKTRELILTISEFLPDDLLEALETEILDVRFPWEGGKSSRHHQFTLLSALPESRLSVNGRRRLGELRRRHGADEPAKPQGITGGFIGSPISPDSANRMNDDHWLRAMHKYDGDRRDWENFTGGAHELAGVLKEQTKQDPARFANLALRITGCVNPTYSDSILMGLAEGAPLADPSPVFSAVRHIAQLGNPDNDRWLGYGLRRYLREVPIDLVEMLIGRATSAADPIDGTLIIRMSNRDSTSSEEIWTSGFNSARGSAAEILGDILLYDADGALTALVSPVLQPLANDPALTVRACVAHLIHASLRHAPNQAIEAFGDLIRADDSLLATRPVVQLMIAIGHRDFQALHPIIQRMLSSENTEVREVGGQISALAAAYWENGDLLTLIHAGRDIAARKGAATVCAHHLANVPDTSLVRAAFADFVRDPNPEVRKSVAEFAAAVRGKRLRPLCRPVRALIASPTFSDASTQLLITLRDAPDRVDDLVLECANRFLAVSGSEAADIRTGAAADARYLGQLVIRGYASPAPAVRSKLLDVLDGLLLVGALGISELVLQAERPT